MPYPAGIIRVTPVVPTLAAASGVWRLPEALQARGQNIWPRPFAGTVAGTASATSTSDASAYTFSAQAIGTASADRIVHVTAHTFFQTPGDVFTSVVIAGTTATLNVQATRDGSGASGGCAIASRLVTTGTTGDITVNCDAAFKMMITVLASTKLASAIASATATDVATPFSQNLAVPAGGGIIIAAFWDIPSAAQTVTWTSPLVEDYDAQFEDSTYSSAHYVAPSGQTVTVIAAPSASASIPTMCTASFG